MVTFWNEKSAFQFFMIFLVSKIISIEGVATTDSSNKCGPGKCSENEVCVSWEKHCGDLKCEASVELEYHECFPKDGEHWAKINPTGGNLCADNETHEIIAREQPCLKKAIPCDLHWWYKCVPKTESPHSCTDKKCPSKLLCYETVECNVGYPCILKAVCDACLACIKHEEMQKVEVDQNLPVNPNI